MAGAIITIPQLVPKCLYPNVSAVMTGAIANMPPKFTATSIVVMSICDGATITYKLKDKPQLIILLQDQEAGQCHSNHCEK
eukprot:m.60447 g.60447  ORF g.60447 m.60447 type:complete len:81 (+) comp11321_c0_seq2:255-497(+)